MEYYSAINKIKLYNLQKKWMELEIIMLVKISQTQKKKCPQQMGLEQLHIPPQKERCSWLDTEHTKTHTFYRN